MSQFDPVDSSDSTTVFPYHDLTPPEPVLRERLRVGRRPITGRNLSTAKLRRAIGDD